MNLVIGEVAVATEIDLQVSILGETIPCSRLWVTRDCLPVEVTDDSGTYMEATLAPGDRVVLLTQNHQVYYLMERVVRYG